MGQLKAQQLGPQPADLWCRAQLSAGGSPQVLPLPDALEAVSKRSYGALSPRLWLSEADAQAQAPLAAFLPVLDFDAHRGGQRAIQDAEAFAARHLRASARGVGWVLAASSPGSRKLFLLDVLPPRVDWVQAWSAWCQWQRAHYPTLDPAMPSRPLARWLGSSHRSKPSCWQVPCGPAESDAQLCAQLPSPEVRRSWWQGLRCVLEVEGLASTVLEAWQTHQLVTAAPARALDNASWRSVDYGAALAEAGQRIRLVQGGTGEWVRLGRCPVCGASDGAPAVSPKGWLVCLRTSCPASEGVAPTTQRKDGWAQLLGVSPSAIRPKKRGARAIMPARRMMAEQMDLDTARAQLSQTVLDSLDARAQLPVVQASPGLGKTHQVLDAVARRRWERWTLLAPTRELAAELASGLRRRGISPLELAPRNPDNCAAYDQVTAAARQGYQAGQALCPACKWQEGCPYYAQLNRARTAQAVVSVWEHIWLVQAGWLKPAHLVVDEWPARAWLDQWSVTKAQLMGWLGPDTDALLAEAVDALARVLLAVDLEMARATKSQRAWPRAWRAQQLLDVLQAQSGLAEAVRSAVPAAVQALDVTPGALARLSPEAIQALPHSHGARLVVLVDDLLRRPAQAHPVSIHWSASAGASWAVTQAGQLEVSPTLVLDAYARPEVYQRLMGRAVEVRPVQASCLARVWQVPLSTSRAALRRSDSSVEAGMEALAALRWMGHQRVLVLCHADQRKLWEQAGHDVDVRHFGQGAGVNTYRHSHTACLVVGTPRAPHDALVDLASALWAGQAPIDESPGPDGPHTYLDPRLQAALELSREDEMGQAIHRIGPALPPSPDSGVAVKDVCLVGQVDCPHLPQPIEVPSGLLTQTAAMARWANLHGWWAGALRDLVFPEALGTKSEAAKARRAYDALTRVAVGSLPYQGKLVLDVNGRWDVGNVWGNAERARTYLTSLAERLATLPQTVQAARQLGTQLGLCR